MHCGRDNRKVNQCFLFKDAMKVVAAQVSFIIKWLYHYFSGSKKERVLLLVLVACIASLFMLLSGGWKLHLRVPVSVSATAFILCVP